MQTYNILYSKKNSRADILSRKNDYIETKEIFNYNISKINKNRLLLTNKHRLKIIIYIIKDN